MRKKQFIWHAKDVKSHSDRQYKYLYQKMLDRDLIRRAWKKLRKGKTKRKEVKVIDADLNNKIEMMREMIINTKPPGVEVPHPELAFKPAKHEPKRIFEHGKWRTLYMPDIIEQWLHHIIILVLQPIIMNSSDYRACGSIPRRGPHYGKKLIRHWIHKDPNMMGCYGKIDIRHFYDSVNHVVLLNELRRKIADEWFLYILMLCLSQFKKGLPLGYYVSQWLANYLLEPVDELIGYRLKHWVRYMDDITIFAKYCKTINKKIAEVKYMLWHRFYLRLKPNVRIAMFDIGDGRRGQPLDFMGFVFYENKTIMRKSILAKATRLAHKIHHTLQNGYRVYRKQIAGMLSYLGWFKHTDSYDYFQNYIKPLVDIRQLKQIISKLDRRKAYYDRLERNEIFGKAQRTLPNCA